MYVLVQTGIDPSWGGHMSNERRVTDDRGKWLIEGLGERADFDQRFIRALRPEPPQPLVASDKRQLVGALAMVAGELLRRKPKRFHCEWAWDGNRLWVVQCDEAMEERCTESANKYLTESHAPIPSRAPTSSISHFAELDWESWTKLRCPGTFRRLELPCADIYVLTGDRWNDADEQYRTTLLRDLTAMCVHPVVVRCDVRAGTGHDEILLPTSAATQNVDDLVAFMNRSSRDFAEKGLTASDWTFLLAHLVHAKASVMIHAQPAAQRVQVDALWGFPDGLLHFPHDRWFYDTTTGKPKEVRRYKSHCLLPGGKAWVPVRVAPPLDWQSVLSEDEVVVLSRWAMKLANDLGHDIELMALARINGDRGPRACLPWHFTEWAIPQYSRSVRAVRSTSDIVLLTTYSDLDRLRQQGKSANTRGYLVRPSPPLLRDSDFLTAAASLAAQHEVPLLFEGSLLGHAYYVMSRTGATVVPVAPTEPRGYRKIYRKLVRDRIPAIIRKAGGIARVRTLARAEAIVLLSQKLIEEAFEVWSASTTDIVHELADVLEVLDALRRESGIAPDHLEQVRQDRKAKRGGFDALVYLEETNLRSLKIKPDSQGRLPLFRDEPDVGITHTSRRRRHVQSTAGKIPEEIYAITAPLVPPTEDSDKVSTFELKTLGVSLQVSYDGNRLHIRLFRPTRERDRRQRLLFPDLNETAADQPPE
jgi:predicted house-cleaning noncanonical NTP pyrophosphatase (MazG superfamily)